MRTGNGWILGLTSDGKRGEVNGTGRYAGKDGILRIWGGVGLINLGQCSCLHIAVTSALVTKTLV